MSKHPALSCLAMLFLVAGCGQDAPSVPPVAPRPGPALAPRPSADEPAPTGYALHEWGLIGVETGTAASAWGAAVDRGSETATEAAANAERRAGMRALELLFGTPAPTLERANQATAPHERGRGHLGPSATGKPVIYLHVPNGAPPVDVTVTLALPASRLLEHWPPASASETTLTWNVRAASGPCATPAAAPTPTDAACRSVRDGFCEAAEIPRYHGDNDTCLTMSGRETQLLFYRGEGSDGPAMPLALRRRVAPADESEPSVDPGWEVVRQTNAPIEGIVMLALRSNGQPRIHLLNGPDFALPNAEGTPTSPETVRVLLREEAMRRGLTAAEAEAFVDAWAPAYFGENTRQGQGSEGRAPNALAEADRALLYFAPEALVDAVLPLTLSPTPSERHRVFLVRFVDPQSRVQREVVAAPADATPSTATIGVGGGPTSYLRHPAGVPERVRFEAPNVQGALDATTVRRVVVRHQAEIQHCHEQLLYQQPEASGRVVVGFAITPTGTVSVASVSENTTGDAVLARCVASAFRRWRFPEQEGVTSAQVAIHLSVRD